MKIGFVINDFEREKPGYTTTRLALEALRRGHEVRYVPVGRFSRGVDDRLGAHASCVPPGATECPEAMLEAVRGTPPKRLALDDLDVLMLRNDPADDFPQRPWARLAPLNFARFAMEAGVVVLNDPDGLLRNVNKLSLEHYPRDIRPGSLISRDIDEIMSFCADHPAGSVVKPLAGSGGRKVFFVREQDRSNLKQIITAVLSDGYALAQEVVPEAAQGDIRVMLMNGDILEVDGTPALMRRKPSVGETRSNIRQGATAEAVELSDAIRTIVHAIKPRLIADGLFLVGIDVAGSKLLEINVFSPGGLGSIARVAGADFTPAILDSIELKVRHRRSGQPWSNAFLNTV